LVERCGSEADRRAREAAVTMKGKEVTQRIDAARERILSAVFATWEPKDVEELVRLARKYADALTRLIANVERQLGRDKFRPANSGSRQGSATCPYLRILVVAGQTSDK
jgi:DNA-binding MarR family transcriptional regulator